MNIEYHKFWSPHLQQDMELKVYGHTGKPVLVFPAQGGRFFEFEDFGMIEAVRAFIEDGRFQFYTVDSVDNQAWGNTSLPPAQRGLRHEDFDRYILREVVPFIHEHREYADDEQGKLLTTGVSMGGYHSANFFFRHPDVFDGVISLSGVFQLKLFIGDYVDETVFNNSPLLYLPHRVDPWYINLYCKSHIILCAGQGAWEEETLSDIKRMRQILDAKKIPAWVDLWGYDVYHDWPWWRKQLPYFLGTLPSL